MHLGKCKHCGEDLSQGDEVVAVDFDIYHFECAEECGLEVIEEEIAVFLNVHDITPPTEQPFVRFEKEHPFGRRRKKGKYLKDWQL
jgi:hypothetical protein